jgi:hypothetical protein
MKIEQIKEIADAVLYEGYLLYPYRQSAIKNRQRWTFGVVYPQEYSETHGSSEPWTMRTECLIVSQSEQNAPIVDIDVRFLHLLTHTEVPRKSVGRSTSLADVRSSPDSWDEAIERESMVHSLNISELVTHPYEMKITFPGMHRVEAAVDIADNDIVWEQQGIDGKVTITAEQMRKKLFKLRILIANVTQGTGNIVNRYETILSRCFVSTHTILRVYGGAFISLLDPPDDLQKAVQNCVNTHTWPVLVGKQGGHDAMLSSPIILYDYPQIAPESVGNLFDGTEIDEILTLRIMTLTDEEKQELRRGDTRARELLERTENLTPAQMMQLHGVIRDLHLTETNDTKRETGPEPPTVVHIKGGEARVGDHVRLHPSARADAFDILLKERMATVEEIKQDFEDRTYLVVAIDDDPGRLQVDERVLPGHRFFFFPEEVELVEAADLSRKEV